MQSYYTLKTRCVVTQLMLGFTVIIVSLCILGTIVQEVLGSYNALLRRSYFAGMVLCAIFIAAGVFLIFVACHFERFVFGRHGQDFELLKEDMQQDSAAVSRNLILTQNFLISFTRKSYKMCSVVRTQDIIGCFEDVVPDENEERTKEEQAPGEDAFGNAEEYSGSLEENEIKSYRLTMVDSNFRIYEMNLPGGQGARDAHRLREDLCRRMPYIYSIDKEDFFTKMASGKGRRQILREIRGMKKNPDLAGEHSVPSHNETEAAENLRPNIVKYGADEAETGPESTEKEMLSSDAKNAGLENTPEISQEPESTEDKRE